MHDRLMTLHPPYTLGGWGGGTRAGVYYYYYWKVAGPVKFLFKIVQKGASMQIFEMWNACFHHSIKSNIDSYT